MTLLAFDVRVNRAARTEADLRGIDILESDVIYSLLDQFRQRNARFMAANRSAPSPLSPNKPPLTAAPQRRPTPGALHPRD